MDMRVGNKYRIGPPRFARKIGGGSFGDIYLGTHIVSGEEIANNIRYQGRERYYLSRGKNTLEGKLKYPLSVPILGGYNTKIAKKTNLL